MYQKKLKSRWLIISMLLASYCALAQDDSGNRESNHERLYQVELIVFARSTTSQEHWPTDVKLIYPETFANLKSDGNPTDEFVYLPASERLLNPQASTLAKSGSYTLLFHQAWRQMIYGKKTDLLITGGKTFNGHQELEGSIALSVAQYLKIHTNLWLTQFAAAGSSTNETWPELPARPTAMSDGEKINDYAIKRVVKVSQIRTMRSNEIHYIDHPLLGIIIKIIPYDLPGAKSN